MAVEQRLLAAGMLPDHSRAAAELFDSYDEARQYVSKPSGSGRPTCKEWWSLKYNRYYYESDSGDGTQWFMPPTLQFNEWMLDSGITGLDLRTCRQLLTALLLAVEGSAHLGAQLWEHLAILGKLLQNIVGCGNSVAKYRTIKKTNPKIQAMLQTVRGSEGVLVAAGFHERGDEFTFPEEGASAAAQRLSLVSAKLQQLLGHRGFTGLATAHDDTGSTTASKYSHLPGFRFQKEIVECSCCSRPINDGSERLFSRRHDAPRGEFRYQCETCGNYSLCETCWDKLVSGSLQHPEQHSFRTHHPKTSQHHMFTAETDANPWGKFAGGGSVARARERLKERSGM